MVALVCSKGEADLAAALATYRADAMQGAQAARHTVSEKLAQVQQGLRTISLLPGVRKLDAVGENISPDSKASIQQLYNNLKSNVDVSEVYIVPVDIDPDGGGPKRGAPAEPILMFDELIVNAAAKANANRDVEDAEVEEAPEVEIFEYRALRDQMTWLRAHFPTDTVFEGLDRPMISTKELITCDNTVFIHSHLDADRSGILLSVPFYGTDGALRGTISAIVRTTALTGYLPKTNASLRNTAHNYSVPPSTPGVERASKSYVDAGRPDPKLLFSAAFKLDSLDAQGDWVLWAGRPNSDFYAMSEAVSARTFQTMSIAIVLGIALLTAAGILIAFRFVRVRGAHLAEISEARDAAEAASRAKSSFLANMSHEIRTPLNGVLGMTQVLEARNLEPEERQLVATIRESGQNLVTILNDILDLSKIEAGKVELSPTDNDFGHIVRRVHRLFTANATEKGVSLLLEMDASLPVRLSFDATRLQQCLSNLVSNAVKFTEAGSVSILATGQQSRPGVWSLQISVVDTGIGISAQARERLFEAFNQADNSTTRRFGGTGLGLVIARKLARLMGGDVTVESEVGRGSTFRLTFVANEASTPAEPKAATSLQADYASIEGLSVLVVDDNPLNRKVVRLLLAALSATITEAENGREALSKMETETFDLVLLDAHMPVMDGPETIARIRKSEKPWAHIPVVALTADAMSSDRERFLRMGMDGYASKPIDRTVLLNEMSRVLKDRRSAREDRPGRDVGLASGAAALDSPAKTEGSLDLDDILNQIDRFAS